MAPPVPGGARVGSVATLLFGVNVPARAKLPAAGAFAAAASRPFGVANAPRFTIEDAWIYGRICGAGSGDGPSPEKLVAAVASRPVAMAVMILVAASAIADFLPRMDYLGVTTARSERFTNS
jgi:hypothetical protein